MPPKTVKTAPKPTQKTTQRTTQKKASVASIKAAPKEQKKDAAPPAPKSTSKKPKSAVSVGDKAPAFRLEDDGGNTVSLSQFSGKILVLYFYPKDSTPGCTQESCDFRDNLNRLAAAGAAVVGLSADAVASHKKFKAKYDLNFPLLSDPEHKALEAYGVWQEKSLYGRNFMGIVRSTFVIDGQGIVRAVFPKVSVKGHVEEVLAAVKALKAPKTVSKGAGA